MLILSLNEFNLKNTDEEIIQGTPIDPKLTFNKHIKNLCKKAGAKTMRTSKSINIS